jgi:hypothetical protein
MEVKPEWGIKFTCIEPGLFRNDSAGRSMEFPKEEMKLPDVYDHLQAEKEVETYNGKQIGDPAKGAKVMVCSNDYSHCSGSGGKHLGR